MTAVVKLSTDNKPSKASGICRVRVIHVDVLPNGERMQIFSSSRYLDPQASPIEMAVWISADSTKRVIEIVPEEVP